MLQTTVPCRRERCKDIEGRTFRSCTRCRVATRQAHPPRIRQTIRGEESKAGGLGAPPDWPGGRSSLEQSVFPRLAAALDATRGGSGGVWPMAKAKGGCIQSGEFNRAGRPEGSVVVSKTTRNANRAKRKAKILSLDCRKARSNYNPNLFSCRSHVQHFSCKRCGCPCTQNNEVIKNGKGQRRGGFQQEDPLISSFCPVSLRVASLR